MKDIDTILVIAFKYNDIVYAASTEEFAGAKKKKLFIICSPDKKAEDFPLLNLFDDIRSVTYEDCTIKIFRNLFRVYSNCDFFHSDTVVMSNPLLLVTKVVYRLSHAKRAVWVEDGLMNYYPLSEIRYNVARWKKRLVQQIFFIPDIERNNHEFVTYLLSPTLAESFLGEKKKLIIPKDIICALPVDGLSFLNGKKIFVGQPLYKDNIITLEDYCNQINRIIKEYGIDYYLPHFWSSKDENIDCEYFSLDGRKVTLEIIACRYDIEIYSISSTVLYSTKLLNTNVKSHLVDINGLGAKQSIILNSVDDVIK